MSSEAGNNEKFIMLPFRTAAIVTVFVLPLVRFLLADEPKFISAEELDELPVGIKVVHKRRWQ